MSERDESSSLILAADGVFLDPPGEIAREQSILLEDEHIISLATLEETRNAAPNGTPILDLSGHILFPGLMNTHVHLCFTGEQDPKSDYYAERPETRMVRAIYNAQVLLQSGVTTIRDCGSDWSVLALHDISRTGLFRLPNLILCGPPITPTGGHLHQMGGEADGTEEIRKLTRLLHKHGANSIKMMATGGQMTPGTLPEKPSFALEEMRAAVETAAEFGHPTVAHVLASEGIHLAARAGFDSLEHCAFFEREKHGWLERCYDEEIAEKVLQSGASAMIGVAANYRTLGPFRSGGDATEQQEFMLAQEERMFQIVRRFVNLGIPIVCGTDAGVKNTPFDETWLELVLLVERGGLSPLEAIRTATTNAAKALKIDRQVGRIAAGYRADLIALRENPLETPKALRDVAWVMRRGEVVKGDGALHERR